MEDTGYLYIDQNFRLFDHVFQNSSGLVHNNNAKLLILTLKVDLLNPRTRTPAHDQPTFSGALC
jgi:hypothetical protein